MAIMTSRLLGQTLQTRSGSQTESQLKLVQLDACASYLDPQTPPGGLIWDIHNQRFREEHVSACVCAFISENKPA